jgi:hypothetical protein
MQDKGREMSKENQGEQQKAYSRADVQKYLAEIEQQVISSNEAYLHSVVALNEILRLPNASEILDEELKTQCRDIWIKLKSTGIQLNDPPILFGIPEGFGEEEVEEEIVVDFPEPHQTKREDIN